MRMEFEALRQRLAQSQIDLAQLRSRLPEAVGCGDALDGLVRVTCTPSGAITDLTIDPRAMRHPSADLAAAVREAHESARKSASEAAQQILREFGAFEEVYDGVQRGELDFVSLMERQGVPVRDLLRRLTESS